MSKYAIFYMRPDFFRDGILGHDWCEGRKALPDPTNLAKTHVWLLNRTHPDHPAAALEAIYMTMQGEVWSPNGEARDMIEAKGLHHTSMSVGDVVVHVDTGIVYMVDRFGFAELGQYDDVPERKVTRNTYHLARDGEPNRKERRKQAK